MYNYKYKKNFRYKAFKKDDVMKLSNLIDEIGGISVKTIKTYRQTKSNKIIKEDKNDFLSFSEFINYLDNEITYLDNMSFSFKTDEGELFDLEYNNYSSKWELTYMKPTKTIDSFIFNMKNIFVISIIDMYTKMRWGLFFISWIIQVLLIYVFKINNKFTTALCLFNCAIMFVNYFIKCKPYKYNKYLKANKANIIFFVLGVVTPYVINFIIELFK